MVAKGSLLRETSVAAAAAAADAATAAAAHVVCRESCSLSVALLRGVARARPRLAMLMVSCCKARHRGQQFNYTN